MKVVVFRLGREAYALDVERVREVVAYRPPRSLPAAEPWHVGVVALREELLPVWDASTRLGLSHDSPPEAFVVVDGASPVALVVGGVLGVRELADDALRPLPQWRDVRGVVDAGEELVVVLDADRLFGPVVDDLEGRSKRDLQRLAREAGIAGRSRMDRAQLLDALRRRDLRVS